MRTVRPKTKGIDQDGNSDWPSFSHCGAVPYVWLVLLFTSFGGSIVAESTNEISQLHTRHHKLMANQATLAEARPVTDQLLAHTLQRHGEAHSDGVVARRWSAYPATEAGNDREAQRIRERSLEIQETWPRAEAASKGTLAPREHTSGPDAIETLQARKHLARLYVQMGDFGKAEEHYRGLLKIYTARGSHAELDLAETLFALADIYLDIRDLDKAEPLLARATQMFEKLFGHVHSWTASCLVETGALHKHRGDLVGAEAAFQESVRLLEQLNGPDDIRLYWALSELAELRIQSGRFSEAENYLNRVLSIVRSTLGSESLKLINPLRMLGRVQEGRGDYAKARDCYGQACRLAKFQSESYEYSPEHCWRALARMEFVLGDAKAALAAAGPIQDREERRLVRVLSFTSERQRLDYLSRYGSGEGIDLWATMGAARPLARAVLRRKGLVLDSLIEDRLLAGATGDPQLLRQRDELIQLRRQLAIDSTSELQTDAVATKPFPTINRDVEALTRQTEFTEGALARSIADMGHSRRALSVGVEQVQEALPQRAVLVEFLRYDHYLGKGREEPRYGALVISRHGEPRWIALDSADGIEKNIKLYQHLVRRGRNDHSLIPVLRGLFDQLWAPLTEAMPAGVTHVIVCPDAQLNFLSFATLLNSSHHFVGEEFSLSYVSSGRDLLASVNPPPRDPQLLVWANPDFGGTNRESAPPLQITSTESRTLMREFRGLDLRPLPGADQEGRKLNACAKSLGFTHSKLQLSRDATEEELLRVRSPAVLHLATHGFVLPERSADDTHAVASVSNPMRRSGLALAGARRTLEAWTRGEAVAPENDGIVTAEEISCLNLRGTWLVVLSACDTGLGEARASEGVMGLRRGFTYAGAQNLLLTLWPIDDERTSAFMIEFYRNALSSSDPPNALALVQRAWLTKLRETGGVAAACWIAGPFILSFKGPPVSTAIPIQASLP